MGLPIVTALLGLGVGVSLARPRHPPGRHARLRAPQLAAMIGLGVGIDYALFIVTRFREGRAAGLASARCGERRDGNRRAAPSSSPGATVIIALLGMLLLGVSFLNGIAIATALAVLMTMIAALTAAARAAVAVRATGCGPPGPGGRARRAAAGHALPARLVAGRSPRRPLVRGGCRPRGDAGRPGGIPSLRCALGSTDAGNDPGLHHPQRV